MADHEIHNNENTQANRHTLLSSSSLREAFLDWLSEGHSQNLDLDVLVNSFDSISEYILRKKISKVNLWSVSQHSVFQSLYNKISSNKWLKIFNRTTYNVFLTAGQLYLKFLEDKPYAIKMDLPKEINEVENNESSIPQYTAALAPTEKHESMKLFVDFAHPELCAKTLPVNCFINGQAVIPEKQNWTSLLIAITERFLAEDNPNLSDLENKSLYGSKVFFMPRKTDFRACHKLTNGKWVYTNYNPQIIVKIIGKLCQHCEVSLNNVVISYLPKDSSIESSIRFGIHTDGVGASTISPKTVLEPTLAKRITEVMSTYFPNGFRIGSPIELLRFRNFAAEKFDNKIPTTDEELMKSIASCGRFFDGKVYIIGNEIESRIQKIVDLVISEGAEIIYYSSFYTKHEEWLFAGRVISEEMLKGILVELYPKYTHKTNYFSPKNENGMELDKIKNEIMRVWGSDVLLSYQQLATRLPYVPINKIKYVLAQNNNFIWNSKEVYSHVGVVDVTDDECAAIADYVAIACRKNGYASLNSVPLGQIKERNYELTLTAIHNAVFRIVLADKYDKRGKIIVCKGDTLNALTIMKEYCSTLDKCSLQDLLDFERELTGEIHHWIPMEAGYSVMVRTDKDSYVAEKYVHFNIAEIDNILDLLVTGEYIPLKSVTTFAAFPHCGHPWNLFLLESYCRRFSNLFRFDTPSVNSRNAGAIIRKSCSLTYVEVLANAVAKSGVTLDKKAVDRFLYKSGYIGRSTTAKTTEIIEKAKTIRERRN